MEIPEGRHTCSCHRITFPTKGAGVVFHILATCLDLFDKGKIKVMPFSEHRVPVAKALIKRIIETRRDQALTMLDYLELKEFEDMGWIDPQVYEDTHNAN